MTISCGDCSLHLNLMAQRSRSALYFEGDNRNLCLAGFKLSLITGPEVALGPRRTFHGSTWCPLIRQHFSSVIVLELVSFQRQTAASRIGLLSPYFGFAPMRLLTWTSVSGGSTRSWLNQLSPGFPYSTAHILDQISGSHLFRGGRELAWGVPLHISCLRTVWWLRCSKTVGPSRPHFSRAPWSQGTGVWSLASWQHSRLYASSCRSVPAFSPALLKVRDNEELKCQLSLCFLFTQRSHA